MRSANGFINSSPSSIRFNSNHQHLNLVFSLPTRANKVGRNNTKYSNPMEKKEKKNKKQKHQHPSDQTTKTPYNSKLFLPTSQVKCLRFGCQFFVKSFTIRHATPIELLHLISYQPPPLSTNKKIGKLPFPSTIGYIPANFTILAHHAWHRLTLGLGTKKSKVVLFVFESESMKVAVDRKWASKIALGEVKKKLIKGQHDCEMARFKFRNGCITFYVYAVRYVGCMGFSCSKDLKIVLQTVIDLNDFLDHTAMLALPTQRSISTGYVPPSLAMVH